MTFKIRLDQSYTLWANNPILEVLELSRLGIFSQLTLLFYLNYICCGLCACWYSHSAERKKVSPSILTLLLMSPLNTASELLRFHSWSPPTKLHKLLHPLDMPCDKIQVPPWSWPKDLSLGNPTVVLPLNKGVPPLQAFFSCLETDPNSTSEWHSNTLVHGTLFCQIPSESLVACNNWCVLLSIK